MATSYLVWKFHETCIRACEVFQIEEVPGLLACFYTVHVTADASSFITATVTANITTEMLKPYDLNYYGHNMHTT